MLNAQIILDAEPRVWAPESAVTGEWSVMADEDWKVDRFELVCGWETEGRGDQDHAVHYYETIAEKDSMVPSLQSRRFSIKLPRMPWSYHGTALKIHWFVALNIKQDRQKEQVVRAEFLMHPRPQDFGYAEPEPDHLPDAPPPDAAWARA